MKTPRLRTIIIASLSILAVAVIVSVSQAQASKPADSSEVEKKVLARLDEIQKAAQGLDADKVFSFVLDNDKGALVQNGRLFLTRKDAVESTKKGFQGLQKVDYQLSQQLVTLLSPTIAWWLAKVRLPRLPTMGERLRRHLPNRWSWF